MIDNNISDRHNSKSSAFFMLNISPPKQEIDHLKILAESKMAEEGIDQKFILEAEKTDEGKEQISQIKNDLMHQLLRDYSKEVMKEYADSFGREIYTNPDKLPTQTEEKKIYMEINTELESRDLSKINPEFTARYESEKSRQLVKYNKSKNSLSKSELNTLNSDVKKALEKEGISKINPEYQNEFSRLKIKKAKLINKDYSTRKLTEKDLVWFAKVEEQRTYKATDRWVQENKKILSQIKEI
ncbi:hypothetical protein M2373_004560 [Chryseobacterium sp. JUb7]|nr:hypothetical protein [Chryseobacterium sp. JUb7]